MDYLSSSVWYSGENATTRDIYPFCASAGFRQLLSAYVDYSLHACFPRCSLLGISTDGIPGGVVEVLAQGYNCALAVSYWARKRFPMYRNVASGAAFAGNDVLRTYRN